MAAAISTVMVTAPGPATSAASESHGRFEHVLVISVDGLRSDALLAAPPETVPTLRRLLASGAGTLNARTDPTWTVTLPNNVGMVTGRLFDGPDGHGWARNDISRGHDVLHEERGSYVASMFDVAHDHGVFTGLYAGKLKFAVIDGSYDAQRGAADTTGSDDGPDKIDAYHYVPWVKDSAVSQASKITDLVLEALDGGHDRSLLFVHYAEPDAAGHDKGWDLTADSPYLRAVALVDGQVGRLLDALRQRPGSRGRTAVILTTDHGGGAPHRTHTRADLWVNYIIPFLVWTGDDLPRHGLYELNRGRRTDPGLTQPDGSAPPPRQPVRNSDAANLALDLLGLPAVPGSTVNAGQDLEIGPLESIDAERPPADGR